MLPAQGFTQVTTHWSCPLQLFRRHKHANYLVMAVIIGYMAGALNNKSTNFKRMLGAGLTAAIITAVIQAYLNYTVSLAPSRDNEPQ